MHAYAKDACRATRPCSVQVLTTRCSRGGTRAQTARDRCLPPRSATHVCLLIPVFGRYFGIFSSDTRLGCAACRHILPATTCLRLAGVCLLFVDSLHSSQLTRTYIHSYDEHVLVWDERSMKTPVHDVCRTYCANVIANSYIHAYI